MASTAALPKVRKLFHPTKHLWFRRNPSAQRVVEVGLTERGFDDVGDITNVRCHSRPFVAGDEIVRIDWEGSKITAADELYHTVWDTFTGTTSIAVPFGGHWHGSALSDTIVDEDSVLATVEPDVKEWNDVVTSLVEEEEYLELAEEQPPGMFADS